MFKTNEEDFQRDDKAPDNFDQPGCMEGHVVHTFFLSANWLAVKPGVLVQLKMPQQYRSESTHGP